MIIMTRLWCILSLLFVVVVGTEARAGASFTDARNDCSSNNCRAQTLRGTLQRTPENFTIDVWAPRNSCIRLEIVSTSPFFDPAMAVLGPSFVESQIYIDDDSGGGLRPLIKIDPTPINAWLTVVVMEFGRTLNPKNFVLKYGVYRSGNPNCVNPTNPTFLESVFSKPKP